MEVKIGLQHHAGRRKLELLTVFIREYMGCILYCMHTRYRVQHKFTFDFRLKYSKNMYAQDVSKLQPLAFSLSTNNL